MPLTPQRWGDLEALFGARGACGGCWCMYWREPRKDFARLKGDGNRRAFQRLVEGGAPTGVLAYVRGRVVGWCAIAPRGDYVTLSRSRVLKPVDEQPVWSVTCFFIARDQRGCGLSAQLIEGAVRYAKKLGAKIVEGYPVEPRAGRQADVFVYTGLASSFREAGFREVARRSPTRPIMRRMLARRTPTRRAPA